MSETNPELATFVPLDDTDEESEDRSNEQPARVTRIGD
jgi:hypothetical protein